MGFFDDSSVMTVSFTLPRKAGCFLIHSDAVILTVVSMEPSSNATCGYPVRADWTWIPLTGPVPEGSRVVRLGYYTSAETFAHATLADEEFDFAVSPGLHAVDVQVDGGFDGIHLTLDDAGGTVCVTNVDVGAPRPASR